MPGFILNQQQVNKLFPFYLVLNEGMQITSCGDSLKKLCAAKAGVPFSQYFSIYRPHTNASCFYELTQLQNQLVLVKIHNAENNILRGQFEVVDEGQLLFIGSPWFNDVEQVQQAQLTIKDFAPHDPLVDLLHLLKTHDITTEDLKELLATVNKQKDELKKAAGQIEDLANFATESPEPLYRINAAGDILMQNDAAKAMGEIFYNKEKYNAETFWRHVIGDNANLPDEWAIEASCGYKSYQFVCRHVPASGYFNVYGRDITGEKEKEKELKVLSQIAEDNINSVVITDKDGYLQWANKSFLQTSGYSLGEIKGKTPGSVLQGLETDPATKAYLGRQVRAGEPFNAEILNYTKSGEKYWVRIAGQPLFNSEGALTGFFALEENITEERRVAQLIKASEEKFKKVLEQVGDNAWEYDFITGETSFYTSSEELKKYFSTDGPNQQWWGYVAEADQPVLKAVYDSYLAGENTSHSIEYRVKAQDGTEVWVLDRGGIIEKDDTGKPLKAAGTHTDITRIKQTEKELEYRVSQFRALSENVPGVIYEYEFRPDGTEGFRYISPAIERLFGIKQNDFESYQAHLTPEDQERIAAKNKICRETLEPFYDEAKISVPGKGVKWQAIHSSFSYIAQDGAKVFTGFISDITERKLAEEKLRANEEKYRSIIANMNLGLLDVDTQDTITYANQSFCQMSGYTEQELVGKTARSLFVNDDGARVVEEKTGEREKGISDVYELLVKDKQGNAKWWLISGAPRYNDKGEFVGSTGIHLDITERKTLEKELRDAKFEAENLAKAKEVFLANMSHEMRTPMNAIMGMSEMLAKTPLDDQQKFYLDTIHTASDNLLVIINDILDLSKMEAGKVVLEKIGFEFMPLVKKAVQIMAHKAEEKGLALNYSADGQIADVFLGDPYRINQVLLNLLSNAVKFTSKGSVEIKVKLLEDLADSQLLQVDVTDTGIGMDADYLVNLFDKFSQENKSTTRKFGGTGLGMSICKQMVELMQGTISVESTKGVGTTFSIKLTMPKGSIEDLPKPDKTSFDKAFLQGKTILVVDDNPLNRLIAATILKNYKASVVEAVNGQDAIDKITGQQLDAVLMDIQMPVMDGYEATGKVRAMGNSLPIIALTAEALKGEKERCVSAGMNDYISKPFKEVEFLGKLARQLKL